MTYAPKPRSVPNLVGRLAMGLALPSIALGIAVGCGTSSEDPGAFGGGTTTPAPGTASSPEAQAGRESALGVLGLSPSSSSASEQANASAEEKARYSRYEAVAGHLIALLEEREPGALAAYTTEMRSRNDERMVAARGGLRKKLAALGDDPALYDRVARDPLFAGQLAPRSAALVGNVRVLEVNIPPGDIPNLGRGPDGFYGDGKTGAGAALAELPSLAATPSSRAGAIADIDAGRLVPDPASRLGAYAATAGYPVGSVGHAVHNAIRLIYLEFGTWGEERIGRVFNSPEARALYNDPVESQSGALMAAIEHRYWQNALAEDSWSGGGRLGSAFDPTARDFLQKYLFGAPGTLDAGSRADTGTSPGSRDGGADGATSDCGGKADGFYCVAAGYMAYCKGGTIAGGCPCTSCAPGGAQASCSAAPPPAICPVQ